MGARGCEKSFGNCSYITEVIAASDLPTDTDFEQIYRAVLNECRYSAPQTPDIGCPLRIAMANACIGRYRMMDEIGDRTPYLRVIPQGE